MTQKARLQRININARLDGCHLATESGRRCGDPDILAQSQATRIVGIDSPWGYMAGHCHYLRASEPQEPPGHMACELPRIERSVQI